MAKDPAGKAISVDDLLAAQRRQRFMGVIEALPGDDRSVKVTPWLPGGGCLCELSVNVPKAAIGSLTLTEHTHPCCGKVLRVVEIAFKPGQTMEDVFGQLMTKAAAGGGNAGGDAVEELFGGLLSVIAQQAPGGGSGGLSGDCLARPHIVPRRRARGRNIAAQVSPEGRVGRSHMRRQTCSGAGRTRAPMACRMESLERRTLLAADGNPLSIDVPTAPITRITVNDDGVMQVHHAGFSSGQFYSFSPDVADGCGVVIRTPDGQSYGPVSGGIPGEQLYRPLVNLQSPDGLSIGTAFDNGFDPVGTPVNFLVVQIVSYRPGDEFFRVDISVINEGDASVPFDVFAVADLYFADDDYGVGFLNPDVGAVGGTDRTGNYNIFFQPNPDTLQPTYYQEGHRLDIMAVPVAGPNTHFGNSVLLPTTQPPYDVNNDPSYLDNGVGLEWADVVIEPGDSALFSYFATFGGINAANPLQVVDPSFGAGGRAELDFSVEDMASQPDGKVVLGGYAGDPAAGTALAVVARQNADGSPDATFGSGGRIVTAPGANLAGHAVAVQGDGKVLLAGEQGGDFFVARYTDTGQYDPTFGIGGIARTDLFNGSLDVAYDLAVQPDGKIVVVGHSDGYFAITRYTAEGALDPTFDDNGLVFISLSSGFDVAGAVAVSPAGRIAVAGASAVNQATGVGKFGLVMLSPDGSNDSNWAVSQAGVWSSADLLSDRKPGVAFAADGGVVAGSTTDNGQFAVWKLNAAGDFDPSFNHGQIVETDLGGEDDVDTLAIRADGEIVAMGTSWFTDGGAATGRTVVAAFRPDGSRDTTFATGGEVTISDPQSRSILQPGFIVAVSGAVTSDGRVLVGTQQQRPGSGPTTVLRRVAPGGIEQTPGGGTTQLEPVGTFGTVNGKKNQKAFLDDENQVALLFSLKGKGTGTVFRDTSTGRLSVEVTGASNSTLSILGGGTVGDVRVAGTLNALQAKFVAFVGTVSAPFIKTLQVWSVEGGTVAAGGLSSIQALSGLTSAVILAGGNLGADGQLGGGDDSLAPVKVKSIVLGGMSADSLVVATGLPKKVKVAGVSRSPSGDARFATHL